MSLVGNVLHVVGFTKGTIFLVFLLVYFFFPYVKTDRQSYKSVGNDAVGNVFADAASMSAVETY